MPITVEHSPSATSYGGALAQSAQRQELGSLLAPLVSQYLQQQFQSGESQKQRQWQTGQSASDRALQALLTQYTTQADMASQRLARNEPTSLYRYPGQSYLYGGQLGKEFGMPSSGLLQKFV